MAMDYPTAQSHVFNGWKDVMKSLGGDKADDDAGDVSAASAMEEEVSAGLEPAAAAARVAAAAEPSTAGAAASDGAPPSCKKLRKG